MPSSRSPAPPASGTVAVIADVHANMEALSVVLADIDAHGAEITETICLGDVIGYGAQPNEAMAALVERGIPIVLGNHEMALLDPAGLEWFNIRAREAVKLGLAMLNEATRAVIGALPMTVRRTLPVCAKSGKSADEALFVHGTPPGSVDVYLHELEDETLERLMRVSGCRVCFVGHTHSLGWVRFPVPSHPEGVSRSCPVGDFVLDAPAMHIVNVGGVGQPRGEDLRTCYVLWTPATGAVRVRRLAYDAEAAAKKILDAGLPEIFARRLLG